MNIVIIDDTQINLTLMRGLIGKIDACTSREFLDPVVALEHCRSQDDIDLVIVDYMMPELDGIEFIRRLRETRGRDELPVLMVTADHEREVRYKALDNGASDFLTKPVDRVEFTSRVRNMLAVRRSHLLLTERAATLAAEVRKATAEIVERERDTIVRLAKAAEFRDPETGTHILRMSHYSQMIAACLGQSEEQQEMMLLASPMHDVGKLGTPDQILLKPGRLTPEEFDIMKQHTTIGWEILKDSDSPMLVLAAEIALSHHEKFDGTGYPGGLGGKAIPLSGRIVAVADVFDALTSERPYKKAWEMDRALEFMLQGRGSHFDPECIDAFLAQTEAIVAIRTRFQDESQ